MRAMGMPGGLVMLSMAALLLSGSGCGRMTTVPKDGDTGRLEARVYRNDRGETLSYRLLRPCEVRAGKRYPLVLFLHGAGERGSDNAAQVAYFGPVMASDEMMRRFPCYAIMPQVPKEERWVEMEWGDKAGGVAPAEPSARMRLALALIDEFARENPVDRRRIYVTGLSMGGYGTWDALWRRPELFAAAAPICGGSDAAKAPAIAHVPIWAFHGADDPVVPVERSRAMVEAVRAAGGKIRYTEYVDVKHDSWNNAFAEPDLYRWMFSQRRPRASK